MPRYTVFHTRLTRDQSFTVQCSGWDTATGRSYLRAKDQGDYTLALELGMVKAVAIVDAVSMDQVFRDTNHIDWDWQTNDSILWSVPKAGSTSVGDLILNHDDMAFWRVADFGFEPVTLNTVDYATAIALGAVYRRPCPRPCSPSGLI